MVGSPEGIGRCGSYLKVLGKGEECADDGVVGRREGRHGWHRREQHLLHTLVLPQPFTLRKLSSLFHCWAFATPGPQLTSLS
jgi:hypothetical protein